MVSVVLLGYGNVGQHLHWALQDAAGVSVQQIYSRSYIETLNTPQTQNISTIEAADVYIIAVPDDVIGAFSQKLTFEDRLVVHTSGGAHINVLANKNRRGIFYPLQTFSKHTKVNFSNIPICVEAETKTDVEILKKLGSCISKNIVEISSSEREKLHVAAVFVNNFTNHLYTIAERITEENNLDFNLLKPLITETARKIETLSPLKAQTGPARRNDTKTIEKHLKLLETSKYLELYTMLTESIKKDSGKTTNTYGEKL